MTSEHPRKACQETGTGGKVCWLALGHPGRVHVDVTDGGLVVWSPADGEKFRNVPLNTEDPTRDAPEALKYACNALDPNKTMTCTLQPGHGGIHRNQHNGVSWIAQDRKGRPGLHTEGATHDAPEALRCGAPHPDNNGRTCTVGIHYGGLHHDQIGAWI